MKLNRTIFRTFLYLTLTANTLAYAEDLALKAIDLTQWAIVEKDSLTPPNFLYLKQDPFPFCYAGAANTLIDLSVCKKDPKLCNTRSSFLASSVKGLTEQEIPKSKHPGIISMNGGSILEVVKTAQKERRVVSFDSCNYLPATYNDFWKNPISAKAHFDYLKTAHTQYHRYAAYSPYSKKTTTNKWNRTLSPLGVSSEEVARFLDNPDFEVAIGQIVFNKYCSSPKTYPIPQITVKEKSSTNPVELGKIIDNQLNQNRSVGVDLCLNQNRTQRLAVGDQCKTRHSMVITGKAKLLNPNTQQTDEAYIVANTWGEDWQARYNSMVHKATVLEHLYDRIIWIE